MQRDRGHNNRLVSFLRFPAKGHKPGPACVRKSHGERLRWGPDRKGLNSQRFRDFVGRSSLGQNAISRCGSRAPADASRRASEGVCRAMMLRCPISRKRKPGLARHAAVLTCGAELVVGLGKLRAHAPLSLWDEGSRTHAKDVTGRPTQQSLPGRPGEFALRPGDLSRNVTSRSRWCHRDPNPLGFASPGCVRLPKTPPRAQP